jgi:hypothetical protein
VVPLSEFGGSAVSEELARKRLSGLKDQRHGLLL